MQLLAAVFLVLYVATATFSGLRLLWVAAKTRRAPELLLGAGSILIGTIGSPLSLASGFGAAAGEVHVPLWVASEFVTQIGVVCFYGFTQQVFRPGVSWARGVVVVAIAALPACLVGAAQGLAAAPPGMLSVDATGGWLLFCQFAYGGAFVWSTIEGLSHYAAGRRRVAVGLLAPVVANRYLLFAIFGVACTGITLGNVAAILLGLNIATSLVVLVPSATLSLLAGSAMFLAILPPAWYLERLEAA